MDLEDELATLEKADRDIHAGRGRIERQKALILKLEADGHDVENAIALLKGLQGALSAMEAHRVLIVQRVEQLQRERAHLNAGAKRDMLR